MRRYLTLSGLGALIACAVMVLTPKANADELTFLQLLNMRGMTVVDTAQTLRTGYAICDALNYYNGAQVSEAFYQITDYTVPTRAVADVWVWSAVQGLCPWHDHRGQQA